MGKVTAGNGEQVVISLYQRERERSEDLQQYT